MSGMAERIAIGADHGGYELKSHLKRWLGERGYQIEDCGTHDERAADYPEIAAAVAHRVAGGSCGLGIVIDGAGIGSCMAANKVRGVRAALCYDLSSARNSREHNDANVLSLGARLIGVGLAEQIVEAWLGSSCTEPRHRRRVEMIAALEQGPPAPAMPPAAPDGVSSGSPGLAGSGRPEPSASAATPGAGPGAGTAFRASAAKWLTMENLENLSSEDLERLSARIAELIALGAPGGRSCGSCGSRCNLACAATNPDAVRQLIGLGAGRIGHRPGGGGVGTEVAQYIDHTLLKPDATADEIRKLCQEGIEHGFASVCINPAWVALASGLLRGSPVAVCTVVGFPSGAHVPEIKAMEARRAIRDGAREIDMVINIGALKGGDDRAVFHDIRSVVDACEDGRALCKVIIETALLTDEQKVRACELARRARADFVKTSTGFASGGATAADVALMAAVVRDAGMGVKASGGIKSYHDVETMVAAGATRIGASAGVKILKEARKAGG
ncbi:MAG: deoxyribose-phosphate aldolase [Deltaproteobacteria bacterium]|nr:deoxyribose-phosphate aldolase [Deltaproteobacteria bacterium]